MNSEINKSSGTADGIIDELHEEEKGLLLRLILILKNMRYGQVQITVHNSVIVQIDKTEKMRFDGGKEK